jgi:subtilase family serine protease
MRNTCAFVLAGIAMSFAGMSAVSAAPGVRLAGHRPAWAVAAADVGPSGSDPLDHLTVVLAPSAARKQAFVDWRRAQDTPGSPHFHEWLTPAQIGERFGATEDDLRIVTSWLRSQGFTIRRVASSRMFIEIAGSTDIAAAAFDVQFHRYQVGAQTMRAIDREPSLPTEIAAHVVGVTGLAERHPAPQLGVGQSHVGYVPTMNAPYVDGTGGHEVTPSDFAAIYDLAGAYAANFNGAGQTIGIIGRKRVLDADITNFGARTGVTMPTVKTIIPPTGADPGAACGSTTCSSGDQVEATLDVQRAGSVAPGANLELIVSGTNPFTGDDGVDIALAYAIDSFGKGVAANIISVSFYSCEMNDGGAYTTMLAQLTEQAAAQGQTVFVCAGDSGAAGCEASFAAPSGTQVLSPNGMCASEAVTCVGGTEFADGSGSSYWSGSGAATGYIPEGAWNEPTATTGAIEVASTGGGQSMFVALPMFQTGLGPAGATGRLTPDVSFSSSRHDAYFGCLASGGYSCALTNGTFTFGLFYGTSAATPSMAGIMALVDQAAKANQGAANARLYELATTTPDVFHDITVASSGVTSCEATTPSMCNNSTPGRTTLTGGLAGFSVANGYDEVTGLGSIDAGKLIANWGGAPSLALDPLTLTVARGKSGTVMVTPAGFSTAVTFACDGLPATATCTFSTDASGTTTLTIDDAKPAGPASGVAQRSSSGPLGRIGLAYVALVLTSMMLARAARGRRQRFAGALVLTAALAGSSLSCGGSGGDHGTDAGTDTVQVTVTATSGLPASASAMLTLTLTGS